MNNDEKLRAFFKFWAVDSLGFKESEIVREGDSYVKPLDKWWEAFLGFLEFLDSREPIFTFGKGEVAVALGTVDDEPSVIITRAMMPGVVGQSAERELPLEDFRAKNWPVLKFPSKEQAQRVYNALTNKY